MSFSTLRNTIKTKLDTITKLAAVFDEHVANSGGQFPFATFEPSDLENDYLTNKENIRNYGFRIVIHQEMQNIGRSEALRILLAVVDDIIDAFDQDYDLGGSVAWVSAVPANFGEYGEGTGTTMYAEIKLSCHKVVNI